ncbi:MAG: DUF2851 family protein [Bacteroidota bacterium]
MQERFLHFIWLQQLYNSQALQTTLNQNLQIVNPGYYNRESGPDFSQSTIIWDGLSWNGDIEIHVKASDWLKHRHQKDPNYQSVILHVVWEEDQVIRRMNGQRIPCLELCGRVAPSVLQNYYKLQHALYPIPCQHLVGQCPDLLLRSWLDRMYVERLEEKTDQLEQELKHLRGDLDQLFWQQMAYAIGLTANAQNIQQVARSLDIRTLLRYRDRLSYLEALLFGQAGFLENPSEDYSTNLHHIYRSLQRKHHQFHPLPIRWKLGRIRPQASVWLKLAQLASLLHQNILHTDFYMRPHALEDLLRQLQVPLSPFWHSHYTFSKDRNDRYPKVSPGQARILLINGVFPFLWMIGKRSGRDVLQQRVLEWAEQLSLEGNRITKRWKALGIKPSTALDSQALVHLERNYCQHKSCTQCRIGQWIMQRTNEPEPILAKGPEEVQKQ